MNNIAKGTTKTKWVLDQTHSELGFTVKHLMITNVKGEFRKFDAFMEGEDFSRSAIHVSIDASSIFTNEENRDQHLRSADFFDVEKHQDITFEGSSFTRQNGDHYILKGMLEIKGIRNEITLQVEYGGINKDPWGNEKTGFSIHGKINRKDWGLNWNAALEAGGVLVSEEVKIFAEVQLVKQE